MDISQFKAGVVIKQSTGYKSFIPEPINHTFTWQDPSINTLLEKATAIRGFKQLLTVCTGY